MCSTFAQAVRDSATRVLPGRAFLRRDRGDALYITDAPRRDADGPWRDGLAAAGFVCRVENGLARITPGAQWLEALEGAFPIPPDPLSASLARFRGQRIDPTVLALFALGLKALEAGADGGDFNRRLRQQAAVCLRDPMRTGGGLYACALIYHMIERERAT